MKPWPVVYLLLCCWACEPRVAAPRPTKAQLIEQTIHERMDDYVASYARRCRQEAIELANAQVDSILLARAFGDRDTTGRPPKPVKPDRPAPMRPGDSLGWVKPIVE